MPSQGYESLPQRCGKELTGFSAQIRQKITERSGELPEAQQMKKARAQILVLNASAVIYGQGGDFDGIVKKLNDNFNYVRIHAMAHTATETSPDPSKGGDTEPETLPETAGEEL